MKKINESIEKNSGIELTPQFKDFLKFCDKIKDHPKKDLLKLKYMLTKWT